MTSSNIVSFFHKHVVPIVFIFEKGTLKFPYIVTSFVLSIKNDWFLITAGHCLEKIDKEFKPAGYQIKECCLLDSSGDGAIYFEPIPFTYEQENPLYFPDDRERDYGLILLSTYYRELLEKNKVSPLSEQVWKSQPSHPEQFVLIGVPAEDVKLETNFLELATSIYYIEKCERPENLPNSDFPLFYGKIVVSDGKDIAGTSGGPILAFETNNNETRYWLVALQSKWLSDSKIVIGCPTTYLGLVLEDALKRKYGD